MGDPKRVEAFSSFYRTNRCYFGKRVLDICCGGGVLGFVLERHGHDYTGVDINPDMIRAARKTAKSNRSCCVFRLMDATRSRVPGRFDTISLNGNAVCHFGPPVFLKILRNVEGSLKRGAHFLVDYRDVIKLMAAHQWHERMEHKHSAGKLIDLCDGCDTCRGEVPKHLEDRKGRHVLDFVHGIWSPFIMETIMAARGWKLVRRTEIAEWQGWADVYRKLA
jgi:SAM-dependent methyltransferase